MGRDLLNQEISNLNLYSEMDFEGPIQPPRCFQVTTLYEKPTYEAFAQSVKKWIKTCVQDGRENKLIDGNESLQAVWDELMKMPVSMDLERGRKIDVLPQYKWERTSGHPYWRTTKITFKIIKKGKPISGVPPYIPDPIYIQPQPDPVPIPKPEPGMIMYFYCTKNGIRSVQIKKGQNPPSPPAEATSPLYSDYKTAQLQCVPSYPDPWWNWKPPGNTTKPSKKDDNFDLGPLVKLLGIFGIVIFAGKSPLILRTIYVLKEIKEFLQFLYDGQDIKLHLNKDSVTNRLSIVVEKDKKGVLIDKFFDDLFDNKRINQAAYDRFKPKIADLHALLKQLEGYRNERHLRAAGHWVRGYFIEDLYIESKLRHQGYVGLPNWFKGFDAYYEGSTYKVKKSNGKFIKIFDNPGLISIKSHEPAGGLKNIDIKKLAERLTKEWIPKMNYKEFEKENIRIINPKQKEVHLILLGEEDKHEFADKVNSLHKLFKSNKIALRLLQYKNSTGELIEL